MSTTPTKPPEVQFVLTLRAVPNWRTTPLLRLRGLLKTTLRAWGFRCVNIQTISGIAPSPAAPDNSEAL